jgi:hypothetical protein
MSGKRLTLACIKRWGLRDSTGKVHYPSGILTYEAYVIAYVLFDKHRVYYFRAHNLQRYMRHQIRKREIPTWSDGENIKRCGAGYKLDVAEHFERSPVWIDYIVPFEPGDRDDSDIAVEIVKDQMLARWKGFVNPREATEAEQKRGMDLIFEDRLQRYGTPYVQIEVKSRPTKKAMPSIFLQLSETNQEHRITSREEDNA